MDHSVDSPHPGGTPLGYMPQLDGLRALALLGVWLVHWDIVLKPGFRWVQWGHLGVWLFFVLSGFLITGILLKSKAGTEAGAQSPWEAARTFYIRRFLRIFPIYYLTIFVTALLLSDARKLFWWHLTYTTDFWATTHQNQYPVGIHFWTLAVEEQFYLMWPWLVLLLPRKRLAAALVILLAIAAVYRAAIRLSGVPLTAFYAVPLPLLGNVDEFAIGALLAVLREHGVGTSSERRLQKLGLSVGLPLLIAFEVLHARGGDSRFGLAFEHLAAAFFFTWVMAGASIGFRGPVGWLLAWRPVRFIGKISYGLFVIHMFVPSLLARAHVPLPPGAWAWTRFVIFAAVSLAFATASWFLFESPINELKRHFKYTQGVRAGRIPPVGRPAPLAR